MKKFIGDKSFYKRVFGVFIPIMIQMGVTNFVNLLDNIMVGALGTESISGVSIVNQFVFIFNLLIFGALSGAGIFTAQYHGSGNVEGVKHTFRFKLISAILISCICTVIFALFSDSLINLFLHDSTSSGNIEIAFSEAKKYLTYTLIGLIPFAISQVYASTLKETGNTILPMISSVAAVVTNFIFNILLIFGLLGFPALGVSGAAIATTVSRFCELFILIIFTHTKRSQHPFAVGIYRSFFIPRALVLKITAKGLPLMTNEFLWSLAMTMRNQCYSTRGLDVLAANSISSTVSNLFAVVYLAMGASVAVIVGNRLGAGEIDGAKDDSRKLIAFSVVLALAFGAVMASLSPIFPYMYDVTDNVRSLATYMLLVTSILMPVYAFCNSSYFTIRSGGKVLITMALDCGFMWVVVMPTALILAHLTSISIYYLFPICQGIEILKVLLSLVLLKKYNWARKIVVNETV